MHPTTFQAVVNPYQGCYIGPEQILPLFTASTADAIARFAMVLAASIDAWRSSYQLIWLELPASAAVLIPSALDAGFEFHHTQPQQLTLVKKLQPNAYVPLAATHSIGVGAVVWSGNLQAPGHVLMVKERPLPNKTPGYFKLPGGMVEAKEALATAIVREVAEETGVQAKFVGAFGLRQHHHGQFGASNIYFVCVLVAESVAKCKVGLPQLNPQAGEIDDAKWFLPTDYLADPLASPYNKLLLQRALDAQLWTDVKVDQYRPQQADYELWLANSASVP